MIITKLVIYNFRSYYGKKEFKFTPNLNLILGSNGDGKTTFFEALNWVLTPDYAPRSEADRLPEESSLVSAKMFRELKVGEKGKVMVLLELKNNSGHLRLVERSFNITKLPSQDMRIEDRVHKAYKFVGNMRKEMTFIKDLFEKENVFPAIIKKYHIFKGEDKLNIFNDKTTLQALIDMFAEVKDLEPYKDFAVYAEGLAKKALSGSKDKANKQNSKILLIQKDLRSLEERLEREEINLRVSKKTFEEASEQVDAIQADYGLLKKIDDIEKQINTLEREIDRLSDKIDEDYSFNLLDEQWILMGFQSILKEYNSKVESLAISKTNLEDDFRRKQEEEFSSAKMEKAKSELEKVRWMQADIEKMKHSLHTERCVYCGSEAKEGTVTYDFIKQRINDVIDLLSPKANERRPEYKRLFIGRNIENLREMGMSLEHTGKDISSIQDEIENAFKKNDEIKEAIKTREAKIKSLKTKINDLYATSSSGENLKDYVNNMPMVNRWYEKKQDSAVSIDRLTRSIREIKELILLKREELTKNAKGTKDEGAFMLHDFFHAFRVAIENTEASTYEEFLEKLSKEANVFLTQLNVDDFTGIIKIYLDSHDDLKIELQDRNGQIIKNPNTSLLTTMHISILFAISELTKANRDAEYPLIFDAPTSSFDEGKDKTFYECLNTQVNKQCIVVTKSFLYKDASGEFVIDEESLRKLQCNKYRIRKLTGFDKLDIATIDTQVEELN